MSNGECRFILGTLYCWLLDFIFKQTWCDVFFFFIISYNNLSMQTKDYWYQYWSQVCPVLWYMTPYFQCAVRSTIANLNFLMNHTSTISFTHPPVKPILWLYHTLRCFIYIYNRAKASLGASFLLSGPGFAAPFCRALLSWLRAPHN